MKQVTVILILLSILFGSLKAFHLRFSDTLTRGQNVMIEHANQMLE